MRTKCGQEELEKLMKKYQQAVMNEPLVALAYSLFRVGEVSEVDALKIAIVALIEVKESLLKQVRYSPPPVVIYKTEPPVSSEQVQIMETMKDQLVQSMGIPISLMNADGHTYSGSKIASDVFYEQVTGKKRND